MNSSLVYCGINFPSDIKFELLKSSYEEIAGVEGESSYEETAGVERE